MDTPILFIHGTNAGPWTMANFLGHFEALGYRCLSPAYRHHDKPPSDETTARLVGTSIADYVDDVAAAVATLDRPPILFGHSLGGIIAQKLAARGLARAIVLLNGSVNWGVLPTTDAERALGRMLMSTGPFWEGTLLPDFETMAKYGLNRHCSAACRCRAAPWHRDPALRAAAGLRPVGPGVGPCHVRAVLLDVRRE